MRVVLKRKEGLVELSHFHHLLSAYEASPEAYDRLRASVVEASKKARDSGEIQFADHDTIDFILACHPSGSFSLYSRMRHFESATIHDG